MKKQNDGHRYFEIVCKNCDTILSKKLRQISEKEARHEDFDHVVDAGYVILSQNPMYHVLFIKQGHFAEPQDFLPQIWMNIDDLKTCVTVTDDKTRLSGCCGPSGDFGTTHLCPCGAWCGTQRQDCWTSWVFIPDTNNVFLREVD